MAFEITDAHLKSYHEEGFTVFREIIPVPLLRDLRKQADKAREIAHRVSGPDAQRLQPVVRYADELDLKPFHDYTNLPELSKALDQVLPFEHWHGIVDGKDSGLGILLEPAANPWCTIWHRDWRDNIQHLPLELWEPELTNLRLFNQVNCALYEDCSTWVVPGSHMRRDLPGEAARFPTRPIQGPVLTDGMSAEERERVCLAYSRSLPGGECVRLNAGDFMLYRNSLWHLGNYVTYKRRATLHDFMNTPEFAAWMKSIGPMIAERRSKNAALDVPAPVNVPSSVSIRREAAGVS